MQKTATPNRRLEFDKCDQLLTPELGTHPPTVEEIASDVKLRNEHNLADGDEVAVEVEG